MRIFDTQLPEKLALLRRQPDRKEGTVAAVFGGDQPYPINVRDA